MERLVRAYTGGNRLLDALSRLERADVARALEVVDLEAETTTHAPGASYDWVVFPIDAVLSVVTTLANGEMAEVGTVGNEGASRSRSVRRCCGRRSAKSRDASLGCGRQRSSTRSPGTPNSTR
jgi:hypothetical protein